MHNLSEQSSANFCSSIKKENNRNFQNSRRWSWSWVQHPTDTMQVILEVVFTANHLTDTDKQNSTGEYKN